MALFEPRQSSHPAIGTTPAAEHIAAVARALSVMGSLATSISTQQRVEPHEAAAIRRLLPALARRYGLRAESDLTGDMLTVTFAPELP
ncbi:MAG TPA: hypothetical protein VEU77_00765 [Candidatus Acidoferrales bacterium]|nr:hypothetical protein [Candidatus Acidoferrales bacterium]